MKEMNDGIKSKVKALFSSLSFEDAFEATRNLRGEYIAEYGVKSWNALVSYYRKANIQPVAAVAAEPEIKYEEPSTTASKDDKTESKLSKKELKKELKEEFDKKIADIYESLKDETGGVSLEEILEANIALQDEYLAKYGVMLGDKDWKKQLVFYRGGSNKDKRKKDESPEIIISTITPENVEELHNTLAGIFGEEESIDTISEIENKTEVQSGAFSEKTQTENEEERVEYMLYQNVGDKVDWYGHFVNYKGLKVGESGMMVRMNNLGVGRGKVLATASMTMEEIGMFHKCYAHIRQTTASDNRRVTLFRRAFNNLQEAMRDPKFATLSTGKAIANFVLNYENEE